MAKKTKKSAEELAVEASKAEMEAKREEITAYYKDSIPHLKVQLEYESLLKDIETSRAERIQAQTFIANAMAQNEAAQPPQPKPQSQAGSDWNASSDKAPPAPRTLKKVDA